MSTTREMISEWFDRGVGQKAAYLLVVCDTFDHEDYPVFANSADECREKYKHYNGPNMQKVMEVYDLAAPRQEQISSHRTMRLPA